MSRSFIQHRVWHEVSRLAKDPTQPWILPDPCPTRFLVTGRRHTRVGLFERWNPFGARVPLGGTEACCCANWEIGLARPVRPTNRLSAATTSVVPLRFTTG